MQCCAGAEGLGPGVHYVPRCSQCWQSEGKLSSYFSSPLVWSGAGQVGAGQQPVNHAQRSTGRRVLTVSPCPAPLCPTLPRPTPPRPGLRCPRPGLRCPCPVVRCLALPIPALLFRRVAIFNQRLANRHVSRTGAFCTRITPAAPPPSHTPLVVVDRNEVNSAQSPVCFACSFYCRLCVWSLHKMM